jgi:hypothetical protein
MASGMEKTPPNTARVIPAALRSSLLSRLESKRPIPAPNAVRVAAKSMSSAVLSFRSAIVPPTPFPAMLGGDTISFDAVHSLGDRRDLGGGGKGMRMAGRRLPDRTEQHKGPDPSKSLSHRFFF